MVETQTKDKSRELICTRCEECLDEEQSVDPERGSDGEVLCAECYHEEYRDECHRCLNTVDKTELEARPGEMIAILQREAGLGKTLEPGYYRVLGWPFFADGMIEAYFYDSNLERVADLDRSATDAAKQSPCSAIPLCAECRREVAAARVQEKPA